MGNSKGSSRVRAAGALVFLGTVIFTLAMLIAEGLRPTYSVSQRFISDLGVGANAWVFDYAIITLGALIVIGGILLLTSGWKQVWVFTIIITGIGAAGVGIFTEGSPDGLHTIFSAITFIFAGISSIAFIVRKDTMLRYLSPIMGIISLTALVLFETGNYYGIGQGGMERMIVYPALLWATAVSAFLMSYRGEA